MPVLRSCCLPLGLALALSLLPVATLTADSAADGEPSTDDGWLWGVDLARWGGPLAVRPLHAGWHLFGGSPPVDPALEPPGQLRLSLQATFVSLFGFRDSGGLVYAEDHETVVTELVADLGLAERWQLGLRLPAYHYQAGRFDSFKNDFEDLIGGSQGARGEVEDDQYLYRIARSQGGKLLLEGQPNTLRAGDLVLGLQWLALDEQEDWLALAVRYEIDLPTGDHDRGMGSGGVDHNLVVAARKRLGAGFHLYANLGVTLPGHGEVLGSIDQQPRLMAYLGLEWRAADAIALMLQARWETSPFDTGNRLIGEPSGLASLGLSWRLLPGLELRIALHEEFSDQSGDFDVGGLFELRFAGGVGDGA